MIIKEIDDITRKLAAAFKTSGLSGRINFDAIKGKPSRYGSGIEDYRAYYILEIKLPSGDTNDLEAYPAAKPPAV